MHRTTRMRVTDLNPHITCVLCQGYLIDATTIIECLHSFCRSCIVRYLESSKYCPICDVQVHKTKPLLNIRSDKTLQEIVYKIAPGVFKDEMRRRREFYKANPAEAKKVKNEEERGELDALSGHKIYTSDESISVCVQHCLRLPPYHNGSSSFNAVPVKRREDKSDKRYLLCPAAFTVGMLKKFIRLKFDLQPKFQIEVLHSDESLKDHYTLMDVAYIYGWRRMEPLKLYYIVFDRTKITLDLPGMETESPVPFQKPLSFAADEADEGADPDPSCSNPASSSEFSAKSVPDLEASSEGQTENPIDTSRDSSQDNENASCLVAKQPKDKAFFNKSTKGKPDNSQYLTDTFSTDHSRLDTSDSEKTLGTSSAKQTLHLNGDNTHHVNGEINGEVNGEVNGREEEAGVDHVKGEKGERKDVTGEMLSMEGVNGDPEGPQRVNGEEESKDIINGDQKDSKQGLGCILGNVMAASCHSNSLPGAIPTSLGYPISKNACEGIQMAFSQPISHGLSEDDQKTIADARVAAHKALESLQSVDAASDSLEPLDTALVINEDSQTTDNSSEDSVATVESDGGVTSQNGGGRVEGGGCATSAQRKVTPGPSCFKDVLTELKRSEEGLFDVGKRETRAGLACDSSRGVERLACDSPHGVERLACDGPRGVESKPLDPSSNLSVPSSTQGAHTMVNPASCVSTQGAHTIGNPASCVSAQSPLHALQNVSNFPLRGANYRLPQQRAHFHNNVNSVTSRTPQNPAAPRPLVANKRASPQLSNGRIADTKNSTGIEGALKDLPQTVSGMYETVRNSTKQMHNITNGQLFPKQPPSGKSQASIVQTNASGTHGTGISPKTERDVIDNKPPPKTAVHNAPSGINNNNKGDVLSRNTVPLMPSNLSLNQANVSVQQPAPAAQQPAAAVQQSHPAQAAAVGLHTAAQLSNAAVQASRFVPGPQPSVLCPLNAQTQDFLSMSQQKFDATVNQAIKTGTVKQVTANSVQPVVTNQFPNQILTQLGPNLLQNLNQLQLENCLAGKIKRKRGRPPKDKNKLLEQLRAQQSPVKHRRLLPKGPCYPPGVRPPGGPQAAPGQGVEMKPYTGMNGTGAMAQGHQFRTVCSQNGQVIGGGGQQLAGVSAVAKQEPHVAMNGIPVQQQQQQQQHHVASQGPAAAIVQGLAANVQGVAGALHPGAFHPGAVAAPGSLPARPQFVQTFNGTVCQQQVPFQNQQLMNIPRQFVPGQAMTSQTMFSPVVTSQVFQQSVVPQPMAAHAVAPQFMPAHSMTSHLQAANPGLPSGPMNNGQGVMLSHLAQPVRGLVSTPENSSTPESESCDEDKPPIPREPITIAPIKENPV